jgi:hypothetical protein
MTKYKLQKFPHTRIATIDTSEVGKQKHHLAALIEVDVTKSLEEIKAFFTIHAWKHIWLLIFFVLFASRQKGQKKNKVRTPLKFW